MDMESRLAELKTIIEGRMDEAGLARALELLGETGFPRELTGEMRLYSEYEPKVVELGFTPEQRYLHFLWECLDRLPIGLAVNFSFLFRRMIAERLFKKCGQNFIAEMNIQFNFGHNIEVGDDVFINRDAFFDSKGGITIGNYCGMGERVMIFTHSHSESDHRERTFAKVVIGDFVKVYSGAMILPGVTIGDQAIVAARSLVTRDIEPNMVVEGIPAKPVRERRTEGRNGIELNHIWLKDKAFQ
ncbi:MAG: acyltransferase [Actinobacteria bacterium]|nr:acyltransferase [Actinomycetota bacterium]